MDEHEQGFIESFVQRSKRERAFLCLESPKKRREFTEAFAHHGTNILANERLRSIEPSKQNPGAIFSILRGLGAPETCHLISESSGLDSKKMELRTALKEIVGGGTGTVISCIPGRLGYFEGELRERFILLNDSQSSAEIK